jgi:hypothetical protein
MGMDKKQDLASKKKISRDFLEGIKRFESPLVDRNL